WKKLDEESSKIWQERERLSKERIIKINEMSELISLRSLSQKKEEKDHIAKLFCNINKEVTLSREKGQELHKKYEQLREESDKIEKVIVELDNKYEKLEKILKNLLSCAKEESLSYN